MTRFLRLFSLPLILLTISGGCATVGTPADLYQRIADRMQEKAKAKQLAKAMRKTAKEEKHKSKHCEDYVMEQGRLEEATETDVNFKLQNGIEFVDFALDFDEIKKLEKQQAKYDQEYDEAKKAWVEYEDERERRYLKLKREHAKLQANAAENIQDGCTNKVISNCCIPPLKEYVKSEPPKRRSVGIDEIPITVRMNVKLNAEAPTFEQAKINRKFIPAKTAKESCCPQCGTQGCTDSCTSCGLKAMKNAAANLVPPAPAITEKIGSFDEI